MDSDTGTMKASARQSLLWDFNFGDSRFGEKVVLDDLCVLYKQIDTLCCSYVRFVLNDTISVKYDQSDL